MANDKSIIDHEEYEDSANTDLRPLIHDLFQIVKDDWKNYTTQKGKLRNVFFFSICGILVALVITMIIVTFVVVKKESPSSGDIVVVLSCLGSTISGILVLPKIIAKHLFPESGDAIERGIAAAISDTIIQTNIKQDHEVQL